jgi:hypothetical protein
MSQSAQQPHHNQTPKNVVDDPEPEPQCSKHLQRLHAITQTGETFVVILTEPEMRHLAKLFKEEVKGRNETVERYAKKKNPSLEEFSVLALQNLNRLKKANHPLEYKDLPLSLKKYDIELLTFRLYIDTKIQVVSPESDKTQAIS